MRKMQAAKEWTNKTAAKKPYNNQDESQLKDKRGL
jgi:hypothetical protein